MEELGIVASFNPFDALESISKIHYASQLSKVEMTKLQIQARSFNQWLLEQRIENKERRAGLINTVENYRNHIERIINIILDNPELTYVYKDFFKELLEANNKLSLQASEIRITIK